MFNNTVLKCAQSSQQKFLERLKTCEKLKKKVLCYYYRFFISTKNNMNLHLLFSWSKTDHFHWEI